MSHQPISSTAPPGLQTKLTIFLPLNINAKGQIPPTFTQQNYHKQHVTHARLEELTFQNSSVLLCPEFTYDCSCCTAQNPAIV